jgi:alkylation response protein AidB-like acyl-CoA dehydrogenase
VDEVRANGLARRSPAESAGGFGGSAVDNAIVAQEFGRALVLEPFVALAVLAAQTILRAGTAQQRRKWLPSLVAGESLIAPAFCERGARGRLSPVETRAQACGGGRYLINGGKSLVPGGPVAGRFIVSARICGDRKDTAGIALFVLPARAKGLQRHNYRLIDGACAADLVLTDVEASSAHRLGEASDASAALDLAHAHALVAACAEALGVMEHATWATRDYLLQRKQFGAAIGTFQAVQHRLADMIIALEQSRAMVHCALSALDAKDAMARRRALSAAKAQIGAAGKFIGAQAIQLHGGIGMTHECRIGHCFKRLMVIEASLGDTQFHLGEIARTYPALEAA